jgi:NADH-quinone oxidoreductase subunit N
MVSTQTIYHLIPEIVLTVIATLIYVAGAFVRDRKIWSWLAGGGMIVAAIALASSTAGDGPTGPITSDALALYLRWLILAVGLLFVMLTAGPAATTQAPEFVGSLLLALVGLMLVAASQELALLFLGLELISIPTYILLYLGRRDAASQEAAVKYFFLSILSSAFYAPDVYQGTTNGNAGLLAVLPKIAGMAAIIRVIAVAMPGVELYGWRVALIVSLLTMSIGIGNLLALWQDNLRRLLAYSSIANAGYMLIGLAVALALQDSHAAARYFPGIGAILLYLTVYALATTGAFATLTWLGRHDGQLDGVEDLAGLSRTHPVAALSLSVFMFSLAGLPPVAGFWGKFAVFASALDLATATSVPGSVRMWFTALAVIGVLNAAVAAAYYLRIIAVMYFRAPLGVQRAEGGLGARLAMLIAAVAVVAAGLYPTPLEQHSRRADPLATSTVPMLQPTAGAARTTDVGGFVRRDSGFPIRILNRSEQR